MQESKIGNRCLNTRQSRHGARIAAVVGASILWGNCFASGHLAKCDNYLNTLLATSKARTLKLIVNVNGRLDEPQLQQMQSLGFSVYRHLPVISSLAGTLSRDRLSSLANLPFVKRISTDGAVAKNDAFTVNSSLANTAWSKYSTAGNGIGVAVIDSGMYDPNPDFNSLPSLLGIVPAGHRIVKSVDFTGIGTSDQCGHGTHVGGIIAGDGSQSQGLTYTKTFYGIAPGASLVSVRVLDRQGAGTVSNVISAVQWCIDNAKKYNIRVLNMSLGHPVGESYETDPLCQACEKAWKSGIVVVCAAGNDGRLQPSPTCNANNGGYGTAYGTIECPGNDPYVITVGATKSIDGKRANDQIATYSSRGPSRVDLVLKPDIIAPGNRVISAQDPSNSYLVKTYGTQVQVANSYYQLVSLGGYSKQYFMLSGTSMSTPVVSGAVALMLQLNPNLSPDTIKARLMVSADKWTDPSGLGDPCTYGAGYLNIPAAIASPVVASTYALSPTLSEDANGNVFANLDPSLYGQRAMWGTGYNMQGVYGDRAMWGSSGTQLKNGRAMWGTGGFWTDDSTTTYSSGGVDCTSNGVVVNGEK